MSKITLDNLSDNLKAYLEGLGLSEEQVIELINTMKNEDIGNKEELLTNDKSSVIAAINELVGKIGGSTADITAIYNDIINEL